jgi:hypothetical protein
VLAPETLELDLEPEDERVLLGELDDAPRLRSGRRLMLYVKDAGALLETVRHRHGSAGDGHLAAIVRPTNLEDVFLRLTGTSLELGEAGA